jgi:hypothetical protein
MVFFKLRIQYLVVFSLLITALEVSPVWGKEESLGLDFSVPESSTKGTHSPALAPLQSPQPVSPQRYVPLPIPQAASHPPTRDHQGTVPASVYGGVDGLSIPNYQGPGEKSTRSTQLPPPPPLPTAAVPSTQIYPPLGSSTLRPTAIAQPTPHTSSPVPEAQALAQAPLALAFKPEPAPSSSNPPPSPEAPPASSPTAQSNSLSLQDWSWMFEGDSDSLVARAIGSAEGTRTPDGQRTRHYRGHTDPGNGVWNLGTFSYQHGANSPEEADAKQLARLKRQGKTLQQKAQRVGLELDLDRTLNALDLANQSPAAALNRGGYIDRLVEAEAKGLQGSDAILWARIYSYKNPDTQRWNAPGLGNTWQGISRDQKRRLDAIASALANYQQEQLATVPGSIPETRILLPTPAPTEPPRNSQDTPTSVATSDPDSPAPRSPATADALQFSPATLLNNDLTASTTPVAPENSPQNAEKAAGHSSPPSLSSEPADNLK